MAGNKKTNWTVKGANGNVYKRYRTSLTTGKDDKGKPIKKYFIAESKGAAEREKQIYKDKLAKGIDPDKVKEIFWVSMKNWLWDVEALRPNLKLSSFQVYESIYMNYIYKSEIGNKPIEAITPEAFNKYLRKIENEGIKRKDNSGNSYTKAVSYKTTGDIRKVCYKYFEYIKNKRILPYNPMDGVEKSRGGDKELNKTREIKTFTFNEVMKIREEFSKELPKQNKRGNSKYWGDVRNHNRTIMKYMVPFAYFTGLRIGEILALTTDDIEGGIVSVDKTVRRVRLKMEPDSRIEAKEKRESISGRVESIRKELKLKSIKFDERKIFEKELKELIEERDKSLLCEMRVTKTKTKNSTRTIPLPEPMKNELKVLIKIIKEQRLKAGKLYKNNNLLFPNYRGEHLDSSVIGRLFKKAQVSVGIEYRNFHCLRHSFASNLLEKGANIYDVSKLMGHASIKTTEIYSHLSEERKKRVMSLLDDMTI